MLKSRILILAILVQAGGYAAADDVALTLSELPPSVRAQLEKELGAGTVKEIEQDKKFSKIVYDVTFVLDGTEYELKLDAEGKLLEKEIPIAALPSPVRTAVDKEIANGTVTEIKMECKKDKKRFIVEFQLHDKKYELKLDETGKVLRKRKD